GGLLPQRARQKVGAISGLCRSSENRLARLERDETRIAERTRRCRGRNARDLRNVIKGRQSVLIGIVVAAFAVQLFHVLSRQVPACNRLQATLASLQSIAKRPRPGASIAATKGGAHEKACVTVLWCIDPRP